MNFLFLNCSLINMINRLDINENNDIKKINNDIEDKELSNDSSENKVNKMI